MEDDVLWHNLSVCNECILHWLILKAELAYRQEIQLGLESKLRYREKEGRARRCQPAAGGVGFIRAQLKP